MDTSSLQGKRALVCGATQGIGRAAAVELASRGAAVTLFARDLAALERVRAELPGSGHSVLAADFHDNDAVRNTAAANVNERGPVHVLVNNTGGPPGGPIVDAKPDAFLTAFRAAGGRADTWRFKAVLPERMRLMDKAAGLHHQELTARSLWLGRSGGR